MPSTVTLDMSWIHTENLRSNRVHHGFICCFVLQIVYKDLDVAHGDPVAARERMAHGLCIILRTGNYFLQKS